jgi:oligopeptide transport system permease protein
MLPFVLRRLGTAIPTMAVIVTVAFFIMRVAPGGPFDTERALTPEIEARVLAHYRLDLPLWEQYLRYVGDMLRGDFGPSFKSRDFTVAELLGAGFPASVKLGLASMILAAVAGMALGAVAALRQNTRVDYAVMALAMSGIAIPKFVMAPLLTLVFGIYLSLLPVAGWNGGALRNMILPVIVLALPQVAYIARLTRGSMIEVLRANYVRTARAKGLGERIVILRHALKASALPVVSYLGPAAAGILTGSVIVETIFDLPGMGRYFIQGALNRDYTLVMGAVILYATLIIALNLVVDLLYALLDPKVRYD